VLSPELVRVQTALKSPVKTIGDAFSPLYVVMDVHFDNSLGAPIVRQTYLHLTLKLRADVALYLPFQGEHKKRGPRQKRGKEIILSALPHKYLKKLDRREFAHTDLTGSVNQQGVYLPLEYGRDLRDQPQNLRPSVFHFVQYRCEASLLPDHQVLQSAAKARVKIPGCQTILGSRRFYERARIPSHQCNEFLPS